MPTRLLHESLCTSESLASCSPKAQDAFPRFLLAADSFGVFQVNAATLKGRLWPLRPDVRRPDITRWLQEYQRAGMIACWTEAGKQYATFVGWGTFQRLDPRLRRRYPAPPANLRELPGNSGNHQDSQESPPTVSLAVSVPYTDTYAGGPNPAAPGKRHDPPTPEQVAAYAHTLGYALNGAQFCDYYTANGWRTKNGPLKDWQAAVRTWQRREAHARSLPAPAHGADERLRPVTLGDGALAPGQRGDVPPPGGSVSLQRPGNQPLRP